MSDAIDRARKAAYADHVSQDDHGRTVSEFNASLDAFLAELGAQGKVIVPREATEAIVDAGVSAFYIYDPVEDRADWLVSAVYAAMLKASEQDAVALAGRE